MSRLGYHGWWVMLGCIACQMDLGFAKDTMDVYMTYIVADFGWGRADFQVAGWALLASFSAMSPAIGYLLDRLGARVVLTTGAVVLGLTFAAYASMTSFAHYLLITPLLGVGIVAMGDIPVSTIVSRWPAAFVSTETSIRLLTIENCASRPFWIAAARAVARPASTSFLAAASLLASFRPEKRGNVNSARLPTITITIIISVSV